MKLEQILKSIGIALIIGTTAYILFQRKGYSERKLGKEYGEEALFI